MTTYTLNNLDDDPSAPYNEREGEAQEYSRVTFTARFHDLVLTQSDVEEITAKLETYFERCPDLELTEMETVLG